LRGGWFSDYGLDKSVQSIYRSHGNGVAFAAPVRNSFNDVVGVLYSFASWRETADIIRKGAEDILLREHPEAFILITDRRHRIISAADSLLLGHSFTPAHHHEASQQTVGNVKTTEYVTGSAESGGVYTFRSNGWSTVTFIPRQFLSWSVLLSWKNLLALGLWIFVLAGLSTVVFVFFKRRILFRIDAIKEIQRRLSDGEILHIKEDIRHEDEFSTMTNSLAVLAKRLTQKTIFSNEISKGNLAAQLEQVTEKDTLGNSLIHMRNQLLQTRDAEQHRNWTTEGMARIGVILRSFRSIEELHHDLVKFVVTYCGGNQGGLFLVTETDYNNEKEISLAACYAYGKKRIAEKRFPFGSGMIGQCMLEGDTIYMASVPSSYIRISSGLGEATPKTVLIVPLKTDAGVCGALELASFRKLEPHQINFVEQAAESIAAVLSTLGASEKMRMLFEQLQQQTEEMKSQEEEMRQNMEELTATQEEMQRKEIEYLDRIKKLEQSLAASVPQA
jgi:methyl-accepting chemotaxis protein